MMLLKMFSVYDDKAKAYLPPFFVPNTAVAQRAFSDCVNDINHQFGKNPADYSLFLLGVFDDVSGKIELSSLELVVTGLMVRV